MNTNPTPPTNRKVSFTEPRPWFIRILGSVVLVGLIWFLWQIIPASQNNESHRDGDVLLFTAKRGPLTISITESGTIDNREKIVVKSEVEGETKILFLVPEGTYVQKDDLLIELDASVLEEEQTKQQITLLKAEAAYIHARENLEVTFSESESNIAKARLEYEFAKTDLTKYLEGEYPQERQKLQANISLAKEEYQRAEDKLAWSQRLHNEGHITKTELEADILAAKRSEIEVDLAQSELDLLTQYAHQRKLDELNSNFEQTEKAFERMKRKAAADNTQAEADLKAKKSEFERQQDQLEKINQKIANCRITAPVSGMVIYATSSRRGQQGPVQEGQDVREGQQLIHLPTTSSMIAKVKIHESSLQKVRVGLPTLISVDALPGRRFTGRVNNIAFLPDPTSAWINPDLKVYKAEIHIDGDGSDLRTGMTCQIEIIVEQHDNAVYIPLQSVVRVGGQHVVYVAENSGSASNGASQMRPVEIGLDNNRMIHILDGLSEGDQVLLAPPLAPSEAPLAKSEASPEVPLAETDTPPEAPLAKSEASPEVPLAETDTPPEAPLFKTEARSEESFDDPEAGSEAPSNVLFSKTGAPRGAALEGTDVSSGIPLEEMEASSEVPLGKTKPSTSTPTKFTYGIEIQQLQIEKSRTNFNDSESSDQPDTQD